MQTSVHQSESMLPVVALIISICSLVVTIAGWFVVDLLSRRRDKERDREAMMRDCNLATSDFDVCVDKWLDRIADRREQMALASIHAKSIPDIEPVMRGVRAHLAASGRTRLDDVWKKYQRIEHRQLDSVPTLDSVTKCTVPVYDEARKILTEPLKEMLQIIHPSGAFGPGDIHLSPPDPNSPVDYDSLHLRPEDM